MAEIRPIKDKGLENITLYRIDPKKKREPGNYLQNKKLDDLLDIDDQE
jgi:hypothetical protein